MSFFGLREKGYNKKNVSRIFDNVKEALKHRDKHGGKIYILDDVEMQEWKERKVVEDGCSLEFDEEGEAYLVNEHGNCSDGICSRSLMVKLFTVRRT